MAILKISSWLFLVISSLSISECKSFRKYLVPKTTGPDIELNDNCFCFTQSGDYRKVPEILNFNKNNLERLVVYLYKDKITKQVKLYIPHEEKQALVPDLAFEVGDKLITIENDKVIDIFDINSQNKHIDNKEVFSKEIITPNKIPYNFWNHEIPLYVDEVPLEKLDVQDNIQYEYPEHPKALKDIDVTVEVTDNASYDVHNIEPFVDINKLPPKGTYYYAPKLEYNIIPSRDVIKGDEIVHIDEHDILYHSTESQEVNIEDETINIDGQQIKPFVDTYNVPSKPLNIIPGKIVNIDKNHYYDHNSYESNIESQEVNIPDKTINIDGQPIKPYVDTYNVPLKPPNIIPGEIVHIDDNDSHYHSTESQEVNIEDETINIDGQHLKPYVNTYNVPSKPLNIIPGEIVHVNENDSHYHNIESQEVNIQDETININGQQIKSYVETINIDRQQIKPYVDTYNIPSKPLNIIPGKIVHIDENDSHYHSTESQGVNIPDETININEQQIKPYNVPSKPVNIIPGEIESQEVNIQDETVNIDGGDGESQLIKQNQWYEQYIKSNEDFKYSDEIYDNRANKEHKPNSHKQQNHYETFDRWFIQQMQRFKTYTEHDRAINLQTIERYILKILLDNDMHVTTEGVLTDSFGTALDVHNLHLRPILIGNTMAFGTILNYKAKDLVMPANMAYLQAILVTNSNPSMILGIIPIGKTVIPPSAVNAFSTVLKPYVPSKWKMPGYYSHYSKIGIGPLSYNENRVINKANTEYVGRKKPLVLHLTSGKQNSANVGKKSGKTVITVLKDGPVLVQSQYHGNSQPVKTVKVYGANSFSGNNEYILSNNSAEEINKLFISLREGSDPIKSAEATNKLLSSLRSGNGSVGSVVTDESGEASIDEDDITERIVGGQAATSSGAPLSVKGRMKDF